MVHLLLKDNENKVCQHMKFMNTVMDDLVSANVVEMCNSGMDVQVETVDLSIPEKEIIDSGWAFDDGLYEKLLFRYQEKTGKLLTRWK